MSELHAETVPFVRDTMLPPALPPARQRGVTLWLRENLRSTYDNAWQFFDLADYLGWRATGDLARSSCTVTCKWTYRPMLRK